MCVPCRCLIAISFLLGIPGVSYSSGQPQLVQPAEHSKAAMYAKQLDRLEADLGLWEAALRKVDPGHGNTSYGEGKLIENTQNLGLLQISNLRTMIRREKQHRSIYGELSIGTFLTELSADIYALSLQGAFNDISVETISGYGAEVGDLQKSFMEEGIGRVKTMEASGCKETSN